MGVAGTPLYSIRQRLGSRERNSSRSSGVVSWGAERGRAGKFARLEHARHRLRAEQRRRPVEDVPPVPAEAARDELEEEPDQPLEVEARPEPGTRRLEATVEVALRVRDRDHAIREVEDGERDEPQPRRVRFEDQVPAEQRVADLDPCVTRARSGGAADERGQDVPPPRRREADLHVRHPRPRGMFHDLALRACHGPPLLCVYGTMSRRPAP